VLYICFRSRRRLFKIDHFNPCVPSAQAQNIYAFQPATLLLSAPPRVDFPMPHVVPSNQRGLAALPARLSLVELSSRVCDD
jgi:hypothetical protein